MARARVVPPLLVILSATALVACAHGPTPGRPARVLGCVALPGAHRFNLRLAPDGQSLYWTEWTAYHGYDETWPRSALVRWPIDAPAATLVTEQIDGVFRLLPDGRAVGLRGDAGVVLWDRGAAALISMGGEMDHLEVLDDHTAIYAIGGGIWVQPLHRAAARWLAAADELLGVDGGDLIVRREDELVRIEVATGAETRVPAPPGAALKALPGAIVSADDEGLALQRGGKRAVERVLAGGDWLTRPGPDGVRAWRKVAADAPGGPTRFEVALVTAAGADRLPTLVGAAGLDGVVRLADGRVAFLVGRDTDRDGDSDGEDETDLCLAAPGARELVVAPRDVPTRLAAAAPALDRAAAALGARAWSAIGLLDLPEVRFTGLPARADQQARWRDARSAAAAVTAAVGDPAIRVELTYADGRRASSVWWASSSRRTAMAGLGGVLAPDPADYDVLLDDLVLRRADDGTVSCAGSLVNQTDRVLEQLVIDCVDSSEDTVVPVFPSTLRPGATGRFSGTTRAGADERLAASVHEGPGRQQLAHAERGFPARRQRLVDAAVDVHDRTRLRFWDWDEADGAFVITLDAPDDFGDWSDAAREVAASSAHDVLRRLDRAIFDGSAPAAEVPLRLLVRSGDRRWTLRDGALAEERDE